MKKIAMILTALVLIGGTNVFSQEKTENAAEPELTNYPPIAIFAFSERGEGVKNMGGQAADILFAKLAVKPELWLLEREELKKNLDEIELSLSGAVNPSQAVQVGQLTGAKIIITGSVFKAGQKNDTYIVAKIIGTETSRVLGCSVNGQDGLDKLVENLSSEVFKSIKKDSDKLVAKVKDKKEVIAEIKKNIGDKQKPKVFISVSERHVGQSTIDPAAQTELQLICKELGFEVTENEASADILIKGEGFSEFATRRGNLVSIKARLEIKALDKENKVIAVDRQTSVEVDLAEQNAGKKALQEAATEIATRLLPKIVK